ncbi:MAG: flagellar motor protein MotA [Candidatus Marinimicrobia bacterium]|nr:flagellar motor protein MotA [Candidatus Neomarinimicrobiota bacterium]|tara:strand:- start:504 stop:1118 length:615 start_codon:yes stop_codon:yes gene_type:complete
MVHYFLEGGAFMWPILMVLIFGLAFVIERAYSLMMSGVDSQLFFDKITEAINDNGTEEAAKICGETEGPVAAIFHAGLSKMNRGLAEVEKAIQNAGAIEMAFLEKNMIWLNAVITIAPMLGFTGTVVGMIAAFDAIKAANDISPAVVAGGISQALLTTAFGLIVAMIIQTFQNVFVARIDKLVLDMEEQSIKMVDHLQDADSNK